MFLPRRALNRSLLVVLLAAAAILIALLASPPEADAQNGTPTITIDGDFANDWKISNATEITSGPAGSEIGYTYVAGGGQGNPIYGFSEAGKPWASYCAADRWASDLLNDFAPINEVNSARVRIAETRVLVGASRQCAVANGQNLMLLHSLERLVRLANGEVIDFGTRSFSCSLIDGPDSDANIEAMACASSHYQISCDYSESVRRSCTEGPDAQLQIYTCANSSRVKCVDESLVRRRSGSNDIDQFPYTSTTIVTGAGAGASAFAPGATDQPSLPSAGNARLPRMADDHIEMRVPLAELGIRGGRVCTTMATYNFDRITLQPKLSSTADTIDAKQCVNFPLPATPTPVPTATSVPTATPTNTPRPTPTRIRPTATPTRARATSTPLPTPTRIRATATPTRARATATPRPTPTRNRATATPTRARATATPTRIRATATPTRARATATPTRIRATATPTRIRATSTPVPADAPVGSTIVYRNNFNQADTWTINARRSDTATSGRFEIGDPEQTIWIDANNGNRPVQQQTESDSANDSGNSGLFTGLSRDGHYFANDIDYGRTSAWSRAYALPDADQITLSFQYYLSHLANSSSHDYLRVMIAEVGSSSSPRQVFRKSGQTLTIVPARWTSANVDISAFRNKTIQIVIEAADVGTEAWVSGTRAGANTRSLVEAAVDNIVITRSGRSGPTGFVPTPAPTAVPTRQPSGSVGQTTFGFEDGVSWTRDASTTGTKGFWEAAAPEYSEVGGIQLQPRRANTGTKALVTGAAVGERAGDFDVDGGIVAARSPSFRISPSSGNRVTISGNFYLGHTPQATPADFLKLFLVVDGRRIEVFRVLGDYEKRDGHWAAFSPLDVSAYAGKTGYFLVEAADQQSGAIVEAGIDNLVVAYR